MAKRIAEKEFTDRNWYQEEEVEKAGTFSVASKEVLKKRVIKKAKLRNVRFESGSGGAFKGFKGLVVPSGGGWFSGFGGSPGGKPLEGLTGGNNTTSATPFTSAKTATEPKASVGSFAANGSTVLVDKKILSPKSNGSSQQSSSGLASSKACSGNACHKQMAVLNCSVRDWIVKQVNTDPLCGLTPIFKDYEKYLAMIEKQLESTSSSGSETGMNRGQGETEPTSFIGSTKVQQESTLLPGNKTEDTSEKVEMMSEKKVDPAQEATSASFNFGKKIDSSVWGSLSSGSLTEFSFSPGNSSLFGKDTTQSKPISSPFSAQASEGPAEGSPAEGSPAEGSSNEYKGGDEEKSVELPAVVVTEVKENDAF